ncbi:MAG: hypothetical protein ACRC3H_18450, partial [Lachnospiraceae bacterium]
ILLHNGINVRIESINCGLNYNFRAGTELRTSGIVLRTGGTLSTEYSQESISLFKYHKVILNAC